MRCNPATRNISHQNERLKLRKHLQFLSLKANLAPQLTHRSPYTFAAMRHLLIDSSHAICLKSGAGRIRWPTLITRNLHQKIYKQTRWHAALPNDDDVVHGAPLCVPVCTCTYSLHFTYGRKHTSIGTHIFACTHTRRYLLLHRNRHTLL